MQEVSATMSFGKLRRGDRLQVDIHDPKVAGLIKGGYLRIVWKEPREGDSLDSTGPERVPADGVDSRAARDAEEEVDHGAGEHRSGEKGGNSSPSRRPTPPPRQ